MGLYKVWYHTGSMDKQLLLYCNIMPMKTNFVHQSESHSNGK